MNDDHICTESETLTSIKNSLMKIEIAIFDENDGIKNTLRETRDVLYGRRDGEPGLLERVRRNTEFRHSMKNIGKKISAGFVAIIGWLVKVQFFNTL